MSTADENMFQEALSAVQAGDRARARDLLTRLLKNVPDNPEYWVWMSSVVETTKERSYCLKEALRLDPQNVAARRGLAMMGMMAPDGTQVLPVDLQKRSWQVRMPTEAEEQEFSGPPKLQLALIGGALVVVIALVAFVFSNWSKRTRTPSAALVISLPTATVVAGADTTATPTRPALSGSPVPLEKLLSATYTPTPLYVNTAHPSEAYRIGLRAFQAGDWAKAELYFAQVATAEPGAVDIPYYMGEVFREQENPEEAIDFYTQAIEMNPSFAPAYVGRAQARLQANPKSTREALFDLEKAINADPDYGTSYLALAEMYLQADQPEDALDALNEAASLLPDSPLFYLYRAQANLQLGDEQQALDDALRSNELDITLLSAYRMIGEVLQSQGDFAGSLEPLNTYIRYAPEDAEAWVMIAQANLAEQQDEPALKALDRALRLDNRLTGAHLERARLLMAKNEPEDALKDYEAVLRTDAGSFIAKMGKSEALIALGFPGDAYNEIETAKSLAKTDAQKAEWLFWRARSLEELSGYEDVALKNFQELLEMPRSSLKPEWVAYAQKRVGELATVTPTPRVTATTAARQASPTSTRRPTQTRTPTATPRP